MVDISGIIKYVHRSERAKIISNDGEFYLLNGTDASGYYNEANYKSAVAVLKFRGYSGGDHIHLKGRKIDDDHIEIEEIL